MELSLDNLHGMLIAIHVAAGTVGLILAWPALFVPKRRGVHTLIGRSYAVAMVTLCLSTFGLFAMAPAELIGLGILGVLTFGWVMGGVWMARRKPKLRYGNWYTWHLNCMSSSVIAAVTAFAVQMTDGHLAAWLLPTVVGSPLISYRTAIAQGASLPWPGRTRRMRQPTTIS